MKVIPLPTDNADALASIEAISDEVRASACAIPMTVEEFRNVKHSDYEASQARAAENARRALIDAERAAKRAASVVALLTALGAGESKLFDQYRRCSQLSSAIQTVRDRTGARFSSARAVSLVDGSVIGVRVTRTE